jgi:hypothetical protein
MLSHKHPIASFTQIRLAGAALINWDGQTNILKLRGPFPDYDNAPKMALDLYMGRYGPIKLVQILVSSYSIWIYCNLCLEVVSQQTASRHSVTAERRIGRDLEGRVCDVIEVSTNPKFTASNNEKYEVP